MIATNDLFPRAADIAVNGLQIGKVLTSSAATVQQEIERSQDGRTGQIWWASGVFIQLIQCRQKDTLSFRAENFNQVRETIGSVKCQNLFCHNPWSNNKILLILFVFRQKVPPTRHLPCHLLIKVATFVQRKGLSIVTPAQVTAVRDIFFSRLKTDTAIPAENQENGWTSNLLQMNISKKKDKKDQERFWWPNKSVSGYDLLYGLVLYWWPLGFPPKSGRWS